MANLILHKRMSIAQYNTFKTIHTVNGVLDDEFKNTLFVLNETGTFTGTDDCLFYMGEHLISYASYKKALALSASSTDNEFPTAKCVYDAIQALPHPMQYKGTLGTSGTITSLPSASSSNEGFTYKVIENGTYASQEAKVGDVFISNGSAWTLIPSGDDIEDSWRNIKVNGSEKLGSGLSTGAVDFDSSDDINATWTATGNKVKFTHNNSITAGTAGSSSDNSQTTTTGNSITLQVPYVTYNSKGHVTAAGTHTETVLINLEEGVVRYDDEISTISDFNTTDLVKLSTIYTDLSLQDIHGNLKNSRETANCYVVSETGYYMLPLVYGNAIKRGRINVSAFSTLYSQYQADFVNYLDEKITSPYIEIDTGNKAESARLEISDSDDVIEDIEIRTDINESVRFLCFRVISVPSNGGNVILSILDDKDRIMWSWHIWLWNESLLPVTITNYSGNNYSILPVNLGSKYDSSDHLVSWYYQWGRKDPLLCASAYNNNSNHTSYGESSFNFVEGGAKSVGQAIQNPTSMYQYCGNYSNWVSNPKFFYNFWDATCDSTGFNEKEVVKTVYDPCPPGYSIPNARVFTGFTATGENTGSQNQFNVNGSWNSGWNFRTASGGSVFFPASGYRNNGVGVVYNMGSNGYYWTAGAYSEFGAALLYFDSFDVYPLGSDSRACGFSVRPVLLS